MDNDKDMENAGLNTVDPTVDGEGTALIPMHKINKASGELETQYFSADPKVQADVKSLGWELGEV